MDDWIDSFLEETSGAVSPTIFRLWCGISTVASTLQRDVWIRTDGGTIYPNLYTFLVAPPGVGKGQAMDSVREILLSQDNIYLARSNMTRASFVDELQESKVARVISFEEPYYSLSIVQNELGVLLDTYTNDFMSTLTDLYDNKHYSERKRVRGTNITLENVQVNMLAATTPAFLRSFVPEGAWDQGFMSRVIMVFYGIKERRPLWSGNEVRISKELQQDLSAINKLAGRFAIAEEAREFIEEWNLSGGKPEPDHPKLIHYNTRRIVHLVKLIMISAASRADKEMNLHDAERALGWLCDAEDLMPDIFKSMASGGDSEIMDEAWHYVFKEFARRGSAVPLADVTRFLHSRAPAYAVDRILSVMEAAELLIEDKSFANGKAIRSYKPGQRG